MDTMDATYSRETGCRLPARERRASRLQTLRRHGAKGLARARVRRGLSDFVLAVAVAVLLCCAVALRVLDSVPLALAGLPLGLVLVRVSRVLDPPLRPLLRRRAIQHPATGRAPNIDIPLPDDARERPAA
jgi:hypothetical protein